MTKKNNTDSFIRLASLLGKTTLCLSLGFFAACKKEKKTLLTGTVQTPAQTNETALLAGGATCGSGQQSQILNVGTSLNVTLWNAGYIIYSISDEFSAIEKTTIKQALKSWEDKTGTLIFQDEKDPLIPSRVPGPVMLKFERHSTRCYATSVGAPATLPATIYAAPNCDLVSYKHEIGHIIGLIHEHQRVDRGNTLFFPEETYAYIAANYRSKFENVVTNLAMESIDYNDPFPIDLTSIMMYGSYPRNAIELKEDLMAMQFPLYYKKGDCSLVERPTDISDKDIKLVRRLYPRKLYIQNETTETFYLNMGAVWPNPNWYDYKLGVQKLVPGQSLEFTYNYDLGSYCFKGDPRLTLGTIEWNEWDGSDGSSHEQGFPTQNRQDISFRGIGTIVQVTGLGQASTTRIVTMGFDQTIRGKFFSLGARMFGNKVFIKVMPK